MTVQMSDIPRVRLAHLPTPLELLPRLSQLLGGPQIYLKRDDCTGLALGGNKVRKLEYLLAEAVAQGADTLLTEGGVQSNHCRQAAAAAARSGLRCELFLRRAVEWDEPGYETTGNVQLERLFGARLHFLAGDADGAALMRAREAEIREAGFQRSRESRVPSYRRHTGSWLDRDLTGQHRRRQDGRVRGRGTQLHGQLPGLVQGLAVKQHAELGP